MDCSSKFPASSVGCFDFCKPISRFDMVSVRSVIDAVKREAGNKQLVKV